MEKKLVKQIGEIIWWIEIERMDKLLEYSRTGLKMHLAAYHTDGNEKSFNKYSIARNLQPTNLKKVRVIEKLVQ